jgi:NAD(P)-dependent dehydrogenase (short-subunit alcohol dehydrogenase family)
MTRVLARELGQFRINVNTLVPGLIQTERTETTRSKEVFNAKAAERSIKRIETPEDLTGTVVYLASADSDFVTGETIIVDGGAIKH